MTQPSRDPGATGHPAEPTPDQGDDSGLIAAIAAILLVGAAIVLTAAALAALLRRRGRRIDRSVLVIVLTLTDRGTKPQPRMRGRSDVARAQRQMEAHYRAAYLLNAAGRIQAAADAAVAAAERSAETAGAELSDAAKRRAAERAIAEASSRERPYWQAHERARRRRMDAALEVADAADLYGPTLGWHTHMDDRTTPECANADGHNFRADMAPVIGWPGTLHGGTCRCRPGPPFPGARTVDEATGFGPRRSAS